jgi:hypothetical protein
VRQHGLPLTRISPFVNKGKINLQQRHSFPLPLVKKSKNACKGQSMEAVSKIIFGTSA